MEAFNYDNLFQKAKLYIQRALEADRDSDLFPFWLSLGLELLIKSTLAKINPVLLAEINQSDSSSLFYALGLNSTGRPKSIMISEALNRLQKASTHFTEEDKKICLSIIDARNIELHSGITGFSIVPVSSWLGDYYKICKKNLDIQELSLIDLLGKDEADAAELMITSSIENIKKIVGDKISAYKKVYLDLSDEEKIKLKDISEIELRKNISEGKIIKCPVCENRVILEGVLVSISDPKLHGPENIEQEYRYIPEKFECLVCGVRFMGYSELNEIGFGGQFTKRKNLDPLEYHEIEPESFIDEGYQDE